jgi:hypothetical protein
MIFRSQSSGMASGGRERQIASVDLYFLEYSCVSEFAGEHIYIQNTGFTIILAVVY